MGAVGFVYAARRAHCEVLFGTAESLGDAAAPVKLHPRPAESPL